MKIALVLTVSSLILGYKGTAGASGDSTCSTAMFGNDTSAYYACKAQFALQSNWFPSPIAGLFSYQTWNGFFAYWQNGAVLETMVNFIAYANHKRYIRVVRESYRDLQGLLRAYGPYPSFDDIGWYGLSYARIYEVLGLEEFKEAAIDILNWSWETGWDTSDKCDGGFWFDNRKNSKQTITNVEMMGMAAKLYRLTKNKDILDKLQKIYRFIYLNRIVNGTTYLLSDGIDENCTANDVYAYTYLSGVFIGGLVELYRINRNPYHLNLAENVAFGAISTFSNKFGIFTEPCEPNCDNDAIMFKGIFVRNLRYLMDVMTDKELRNKCQEWLDFNVNAIVKYGMCDKVPIAKCNIILKDGPAYFKVTGPVFSPDWNGPFHFGAPMQQTSALDLFVSAIKQGTSCAGKYCDYDPYYPPPQPLTCDSHPCPKGQDCCEYSPSMSYSCCEKRQICNKTVQGICM